MLLCAYVLFFFFSLTIICHRCNIDAVPNNSFVAGWLFTSVSINQIWPKSSFAVISLSRLVCEGKVVDWSTTFSHCIYSMIQWTGASHHETQIKLNQNTNNYSKSTQKLLSLTWKAPNNTYRWGTVEKNEKSQTNEGAKNTILTETGHTQFN